MNTIQITKQGILDELRDAARMTKEQCEEAVATASDAVGYPNTAEECLMQIAKTYSYVRYLIATIDKLVKEEKTES